MVYNGWFSVENRARRAALYIVASGDDASQTVMIEVRDKCVSALWPILRVGGRRHRTPSGSCIISIEIIILVLQQTKYDSEEKHRPFIPLESY